MVRKYLLLGIDRDPPHKMNHQSVIPEEEETLHPIITTTTSFTLNFSNLAPAIILFFLIIVANNAGALFSCELRNLLAENMLIKHFMGIVIIYVFVVIDQENLYPGFQLLYSLIIYIWFIMIMRSRLPYVTTSLLLLFIVFCIHSYQNYINNTLKHSQNPRQIKSTSAKLDMAKNIGILGSFVVSLVGFIAFIIETKKLFGESWTFRSFWLGISESQCNAIRQKSESSSGDVIRNLVSSTSTHPDTSLTESATESAATESTTESATESAVDTSKAS